MEKIVTIIGSRKTPQLELDFIEWNEKKNAFISIQDSKPLKIKQLKSLVQEALKKKLNSSEFYKNEIEKNLDFFE